MRDGSSPQRAAYLQGLLNELASATTKEQYVECVQRVRVSFQALTQVVSLEREILFQRDLTSSGGYSKAAAYLDRLLVELGGGQDSAIVGGINAKFQVFTHKKEQLDQFVESLKALDRQVGDLVSRGHTKTANEGRALGEDLRSQMDVYLSGGSTLERFKEACSTLISTAEQGRLGDHRGLGMLKHGALTALSRLSPERFETEPSQSIKTTQSIKRALAAITQSASTTMSTEVREGQHSETRARR
jgi:hypothetical protein